MFFNTNSTWMNEGIHWFSLDGGQVCVKKMQFSKRSGFVLTGS